MVKSSKINNIFQFFIYNFERAFVIPHDLTLQLLWIIELKCLKYVQWGFYLVFQIYIYITIFTQRPSTVTLLISVFKKINFKSLKLVCMKNVVLFPK